MLRFLQIECSEKIFLWHSEAHWIIWRRVQEVWRRGIMERVLQYGRVSVVFWKGFCTGVLWLPCSITDSPPVKSDALKLHLTFVGHLNFLAHMQRPRLDMYHSHPLLSVPKGSFQLSFTHRARGHLALWDKNVGSWSYTVYVQLFFFFFLIKARFITC